MYNSQTNVPYCNFLLDIIGDHILWATAQNVSLQYYTNMHAPDHSWND